MSKQRWKDTLPQVTYQQPSLVMAAQHLVNALGWSSSRDRGVSAGWAAAHIRAYRKTLDVEGAHRRNACQQVDEAALWAALESVMARDEGYALGVQYSMQRLAQSERILTDLITELYAAHDRDDLYWTAAARESLMMSAADRAQARLWEVTGDE